MFGNLLLLFSKTTYMVYTIQNSILLVKYFPNYIEGLYLGKKLLRRFKKKKMETYIKTHSNTKKLFYVLATLTLGSSLTPVLKAEQIANSSIDLKNLSLIHI